MLDSAVLRHILRRLDTIETLLRQQGVNQMATLQDVLAAVAAQKTVADSMVVYLQQAAAAAGIKPEDLDSLITQIKANSNEISAAMVANTPVAATQTPAAAA